MKVSTITLDSTQTARVAERKGRDLDDEQTEKLRAEVRRWVEESGQSKSSVAEALEVDPSTISSLLSKRSGGSFAMAFAVCAKRGIPLSAILGEELARRIIALEIAPEEPVKDPKRRVQRGDLYGEMPEIVRRAFDVDDKYTSSALAGKVTVEVYTRRLLELLADYRSGVLPDPDELKSGARLLPRPEDPDAPKR
jgi:transcriptional regulator with XRE-family HTH domain